MNLCSSAKVIQTWLQCKLSFISLKVRSVWFVIVALLLLFLFVCLFVCFASTCSLEMINQPEQQTRGMALFYTSKKQHSEKSRLSLSCSAVLARFLIYSSSDTFHLPQECITKLLFSIIIQLIQNNVYLHQEYKRNTLFFCFDFLFSRFFSRQETNSVI